MFEFLLDVDNLMAFAVLISLEIVLGIDNIIFISIMVNRLPAHQRDSARRFGIGLALVSRLALLFSLYWVMGLVEPLFAIFNHNFSGRDLILLIGGLFLVVKSANEIRTSLKESENTATANAANVGVLGIIIQIALIDIVFSLDSVITAVGLVDHISIMVIAIISAVAVMLFAAKPIGEFIDKNPEIKMLALAFLIMIGFTLFIEGMGFHVPKGYIYVAMAFSVGVEILNMQLRKRKKIHS